MPTKVYELDTGRVFGEYSLEPKLAIVAAWEQHHKNFNTWEYAKKIEAEVYPLEKSRLGWTLGNFWVPF